jgi:hypothetical protein
MRRHCALYATNVACESTLAADPLLNGCEVWTNQLTASKQAFERRLAQEERSAD